MGETTGVPRLFTVAEASRALGVQRWRLYELIARGEGPASMRLGRTIRISEAALVAWVEERSAAKQPPAA